VWGSSHTFEIQHAPRNADEETIRQVEEEEKRRVEAVAAALREVIPSHLHPVL